MVEFQNYLKSYLGIDKNDSSNIVSCKKRDETFCLVFKQFLIMSNFKEKSYFSIAPQYFQNFYKNFKTSKSNNLNDLMLEIDNIFCELIERYSVNKYFRFSNPNNIGEGLYLSERVLNLNENNKELYFKLLGNRGSKFKENQWKKREHLIKDKRYFVIIENNEIAAYSVLSNIDNGGANILVVTLPKYRKKEYGKAVVSKSIEWCNNNDLLPIYLVNQSNIASINLAKSLGFKLKTEEVIVSV